ncbi:hypothetical protein HPB50_016617 [Hyalomma asiaticum]|uniref:Uncharacterized protein n=1 Tax=Hyalomma asiaticum TaxID=266040 RepID=A0ACB7SHN8_HYAAI|nr:hypothetical protein HPB50_016617 [Hyalomma asiaticum]
MTAVSTAVVGDSQTKYLYQHFDPAQVGTPVFITQCGANIDDVRTLLDFVPPSTTTLILSVGTNDLVRNTGRVTFDKYRNMLNFIISQRPEIHRIHAALVLPRSTNRRRGGRNTAVVQHCNREACDFNRRLRDFCRHSRRVFFLDHGFEWFPSARVLAADGVHPSFEGVALIASHIRQLCLRYTRNVPSCSWLDHGTSRPRKQRSPDRVSSALNQQLGEPSGGQRFSGSPNQAPLHCVPSSQRQHPSEPSFNGQLNSSSRSPPSTKSSLAQEQPYGDPASGRRTGDLQAVQTTTSRRRTQPSQKRSDSLPVSHPYELRSSNSSKVSKN